MKKPAIHATDHAIIRYIERVLGHDLTRVRAEISARVETGVDMGANGVIVDGLRFVLNGKTVVTITNANDPCRRTGCVRDKRQVPDRV